jgi:phosphosulfolactate synthase (CoM biosynthesis protein A)
LKSLFDKWLRSVAKSDNTKRNYSHAINAYCEFLDKSPDDLITEAESEIKEGYLMRERSVSDDVPDMLLKITGIQKFAFKARRKNYISSYYNLL